jgi:RHS repeat-associated protein
MPTLRRLLVSLGLVVALVALFRLVGSGLDVLSYGTGFAVFGDKFDFPTCSSGSCGGMARWRISEPYLNLWVDDEPLGYDPSTGPRVSFLLSYQQRGTVDDPLFFQPGVFWNCSWKSCVVVTNAATAGEIFFPGGGSSVMEPGAYDYRTRATLTSYLDINTNQNYLLDFPDGSRIYYTFRATNDAQNVVTYFMSSQSDPTGQSLFFHYTRVDLTDGLGSKTAQVTLNSVTDADSRTTTLAYTNTARPTLITSVTDPYSRTARLLHDGYFLTNITDVVGINSGFLYEPNTNNGSAMVEMTTPYGTTSFQHWPQARPSNIPPFYTVGVLVGSDGTVIRDGASIDRGYFAVSERDTSRACLITHPNGAQEGYALFMDASILSTNSPYGTNVTMFPATLPSGMESPTLPVNRLPISAGTSDTTNLNQAVSFHWNARTFPQLSTNFSLAHTFTNLTASDIKLAHVKQWLHDSPDSLNLRGLNYEREPSPDGTKNGRQLWYDYAGKGTNSAPGQMEAVRSVAEVLPGGLTNVVFFERNTFGNVTTRIESWSPDASGAAPLYRTNTYAYAANGVDLVAVTDAAGFSVGLAYNATHQVGYFTNASSEVTTNSYNSRAQIQTVQTPAGLVVQHEYATSGPGIYYPSKVYAAAIKTTNSYTFANGLVATRTTPLGLTVGYSWDNLQRLTGMSFPDTTSVSNLYDRLDLQATKDRLNHWTSASYDNHGFLAFVTNALNKTVSFGYCSCGLLESTIDELGKTTAFHYDNVGRRAWTDYPAGISVTNAYDVAGRLTSVTDQLGERDFEHTVHGPVAQVSSADGYLWKATFDPRDLATNVVNRLGVLVASRFDGRGRLAARALGSNPAELFYYGPAGLIAYTNENGGLERTLFARDAAGRLTAETNANLEITRYTYDGGGNLTNLVDGRSKKTSWEYDAEGRLSKKRDDAGTILLDYAYYANGLPHYRTTARSITATYTFDAVNRLKTVAYSSGDPGLIYNYDDAERLSSMVDGLGTTSFGRDDLGRLTSEDGPWTSDTVSYGYTNVFRRWMTVAGSTAWGETNTYDPSGRLQSVASTAGSFSYGYGSATANGMVYGLPTNLGLPGSLRVTNYFDSLGRMASTRLINGTTALDLQQYLFDPAFQRTNEVRLDGSSVGYGYDRDGQLTSVTAKESGGTARLNEQLGYFYDAGHNLSRRTNNALVETFNLDAVNQLSTLTRSGSLTVVGTVSPGTTNVTVNGVAGSIYADHTFAASGVAAADGNNTFTVQSLDPLARTSTETDVRYLPATATCAYDADGNLTSDGYRSFTYDAESRLKTVYVTGQWRCDYVYDGFSRRRITTNATWTGSAFAATNVVYALYDGLLLVQERTNSSTPQITYVRGLDLSGRRSGAGGIGGLLARVDHANARMDLYHADGAGNITAMASTNGTVVARYLYDPFGTLLASSGQLAGANVMRFSSKPWQDAPGLYDFGFRFYDPNLQRWINRDPIQENGGINLYGFVNNNPKHFIDTDGLGISSLDNDPALTAEVLYGDESVSAASKEAVGRGIGALGLLANALRDFLSPPLDDMYSPPLPLPKKGEECPNDSAEPQPDPSGGGSRNPPNKPPCGPKQAPPGFPGDGMEDHHRLPRQFKDWFEASPRNLDIEAYTQRMPMQWHRGAEIGIQNQGYNAAWKTFIGQNPNATAAQVLEYLAQLEKSLGFGP